MAKLFRRDSKGIAQLLRSEPVQKAMDELSERIASEVREETGAEVVVDSYKTDRSAASVTIKDARGRLWEVRDGVLTRAAKKQGLDVRRKA